MQIFSAKFLILSNKFNLKLSITIDCIHTDIHLSQMKCDKYWPSECGGDEQYGDINIHYEKEEILSDFTIRTLLMSKVRFCDTSLFQWQGKSVFLLFRFTPLLKFKLEMCQYPVVAVIPNTCCMLIIKIQRCCFTVE